MVRETDSGFSDDRRLPSLEIDLEHFEGAVAQAPEIDTAAVGRPDGTIVGCGIRREQAQIPGRQIVDPDRGWQFSAEPRADDERDSGAVR